jgi:integrase/recombinase XerD
MSKGRQRWIFLPPSTIDALDRYLTARDQLQSSRLSLEHQPVFVGHASNADPTGLSSRRAQQIVRALSTQALERLGDEPDRRRPLHPHDFRHYQITQVWRKTGDLHLAQTLAGHADPRTTAGYTHASREDLGSRASRIWQDDEDDTPPESTEAQDA